MAIICVAIALLFAVAPGGAEATWVSPTGNVNGTGWSNGNLARDGNTSTYASHAPALNWGGWQTFSYTDSVYSDRFRVHTDFGYGEVDSVQIEISLDNVAWTTVHRGTVLDATWDTKTFAAQYARYARFRYHRVSTSYTFWLYEFQLFETPTLIDTPAVSTTAPTSIDENSAVMHGRLDNDGGEPSELRFQYGLTTSYEIDSTAWVPDLVSGNTSGIMLTGLAPATTYHYRVQGRNSTAVVSGADGTFTTAPLVSPGWVSPTSTSDATGRWTETPQVHDDETGSFAKCFHTSGDPSGVWSPYIYLEHDSIGVDSVRFFAKDDANIDWVHIAVSSDGVSWQTVYDASFANQTWIKAPVPSQWVTQARARFRVNNNGVGLYWEFHEFDMHQTGTPAVAFIDSQWVAEGDTLTFDAGATDFDGDSLVLTAMNLPANATFTDSTNGAGSTTFSPDFTQAGAYGVTIIASDGALADSQVVWITVADVNRTPALAAIDSQWVDEGDTLAFDVNATDPDGDSLVLSAMSVPANATFTDSTNGAGSMIFTPDFTQTGVYGVTVIAADTSLADSQVVWITVADVNRTPALAVIDSQWVDEGDTLTFGANATDPDGDSLVLSAMSVPANATFTDSTNGAGSMIFTPDFTQAGVYGVTVFAADTSLADSQVVWVTVADVNRTPALAAIDSQWVDEGDTLAFDVNATDPDGDSLVLSAMSVPANATFTDSTNGAGSMIFTPDFTQAGVYGVTVIVADTSFADSQVVWITVADVNRTPTLAAIDSQWVDEGDILRFGASATDPDGDSLALSATGLPTNATFFDSTNGAGSLTFAPGLTQGGIYGITVIASDGVLADSQVVWVRVMQVNQAPVLSVIDSQWVAEGDTLTFSAFATDFDPDSLGLGAFGIPVNATFTDSGLGTGAMTFAPDFTQAGTYVVTITVSDGALADSQAVIITVTNVNIPPALAPVGPQTVDEGDTVTFNLVATDFDGDSLVLSAENLPANATFTDSANGAGSFAFSPDYDQAGLYSVTFIAWDGALADTIVVAISVGGVNLPPVITGPDSLAVDEGALLAFTVHATDPDGNTLTLTAEELPPFAAIVDSGNGNGGFTFAPDYDQAGVFLVTFVATDGLLADTIAVTITVNDVNRAPVLAALAAQTVAEGETLFFAVSATDPDGDSIAISSADVPPSAAFVDSGNGAGSFTFAPDYQQAGVYDVTFIATDGSLADTFTVTVTVSDVNRTPVISAPDPHVIDEGEVLAFLVTATDPDGDDMALTCANPPINAAFVDSGNGTGGFSFTPDFDQAGSYAVNFIATDGSAFDTITVAITVGTVNRAPAIAAPGPQEMDEGDTLAVSFNAVDPDDDDLMLSAEDLPPNAAFADSGGGTGGIRFTPDYTQNGAYTIRLIASDGALSDTAFVSITVGDVNRGPQITAVDTHAVPEGGTVAFAVTGSDPDGDSLALFAVHTPPNATLIEGGNGAGTFTFSPDYTQAGVHVVTFVVTDGALADSVSVVIEVTEENRPPLFAGVDDASVTEGDTLALEVEASDPDGDDVALTTIDLPQGATFTDLGAGRGSLVFRPDYEQAGEIPVSIAASDGFLSDTLQFTIVVGEANRPPRFAESSNPTDPETREGSTLILDIFASDPDGTVPSIRAMTLPENATFTDSEDGSGRFVFSPDYEQAGDHIVSWVTTDGELADSLTLIVKVQEGNRAPVVAPVDSQVVAEGTILAMRVEAYDPDGSVPSIVAENLVENAAFVDSGNGAGLLTFAPGYLQSGSYEILLIASDSESAESLTVKVIVTDADLPRTFKMIGNHPNPFNAATNFSFVLGAADGGAPIPVSVKVYNVRGAEVATLVRESLPPGPHTFLWNGLDRTGEPVVSGMYIFVLQAAGRSESKKALLVR